MMRYAAMAPSIHTLRLRLQLRDEGDAAWNHELLGEHEGGTTESVQDVRLRLAEQRIQARHSGIGLFTIRRCADDEPLGYCGLIVGPCAEKRTFTDQRRNVTLLDVPPLDDNLTQPAETISNQSDRTPMATRPFATDDDSVEGFLPADRPQAANRFNRYQLHVVASQMADVVQSAGGWLCDRARAGWDVNVLVADHQDARPLMILGATALDLDAEFASIMRKASRGGALAVSAGLLGMNARVRDEVLRLLKRSLTEVIVWGDEWPAELGRKVDPVQHQMSCAARAFKARALGAAAVSNDSIASTETLFRIGTGSFRPLYSV